jgi:hypothetical protein
MATTFEVTCFERMDGDCFEVGTFNFEVCGLIAVGMLLDEMVVTAVRWVDESARTAEVEVEFV